MTQNVFVQAIKILLIDLLGEILYFPIWWYTQGLKRIVLGVFNSIKNANHNFAVGLMFKSLNKPMYGQYDREGRIISFFFRLILTLARSIAFLILVIFYLLIIVFWIFLPPMIIWGIFNNFSTIWKA